MAPGGAAQLPPALLQAADPHHIVAECGALCEHSPQQSFTGPGIAHHERARFARVDGVLGCGERLRMGALPYLYGIGLTTSGVILKSAGIDPQKMASELSTDELNKIQKIIERTYKIEGDLRKEVAQNQKHYRETGTWHGYRLSRRLPIRGRSKTNSRTTRGNVRKTMGSGRAKSSEKT